MPVRLFADDYDGLSDLTGARPQELRTRDLSQQPERWISVDAAGDAVAALTVRRRPDDRRFGTFVGDRSAFVDLADHAVAEGEAVYAHVGEHETERVGELRRAHFDVDLTMDVVSIAFERALRLVAKAPLPEGFRVVAVDAVDRDALLVLDNVIRNDVPGLDGWRGDRDRFDEELSAAPAFDPSAYLVALDPSGACVGLVRFWRNVDAPRLGLIGVRRSERGSLLAAALLRHGLLGAAAWGSPTFTTEVSPVNTVLHRRLERVGAQHTGRLLRFVRLPPIDPRSAQRSPAPRLRSAE